MNKFCKLSSKGIVFYERPNSIPYSYRITYRVAILCLLMRICSPRKGCSLVKMHIINDGLKDSTLVNRIKKDLQLNIHSALIRFEPALNRALEYALYEGLIVQQGNGKYKLTVRGNEFTNDLLKDEDVFQNEKEKLSVLFDEFDDDIIEKLLIKWGVNDD